MRNAKCVIKRGGCFLLPAPTVTNSFYFRKWSTLYCPDFPLAPSASGRPKHSFGDKGSAKKRISKENGKKMVFFILRDGIVKHRIFLFFATESRGTVSGEVGVK